MKCLPAIQPQTSSQNATTENSDGNTCCNNNNKHSVARTSSQRAAHEYSYKGCNNNNRHSSLVATQRQHPGAVLRFQPVIGNKALLSKQVTCETFSCRVLTENIE